MILSEGGVNFIKEEADYQEELKLQSLMEKKEKIKEMEILAEKERTRRINEEIEKRHKEAKLKLTNSKRTGISAGQSLPSSNLSPFQGAQRRTVVQNINNLAHVASERSTSQRQSVFNFAMALGVVMSTSSSTGSYPQSVLKLKQVILPEVKDPEPPMNNSEILKATVDQITEGEDMYLAKKAENIKKKIEKDQMQDSIRKRLEEMYTQTPTSKSLIQQSLLMSKVRGKLISDGCVKELKEMQRLKKLGYKHCRKLHKYEEQLSYCDKKWNQENIERSKAGHIFDQMNNIDDEFHNIVNKGLKRGGIGKLPALNARVGIKKIPNIEASKSCEPIRHDRTVKHLSMTHIKSQPKNDLPTTSNTSLQKITQFAPRTIVHVKSKSLNTRRQEESARHSRETSLAKTENKKQNLIYDW